MQDFIIKGNEFEIKYSSDKFNTEKQQDFFNTCVTAFHNEVKNLNIAGEGMVEIPFLLEVGKKYVLRYLNDFYYKGRAQQNIDGYFKDIINLSICGGIVFAEMQPYKSDCMSAYDDYIEDGITERAYTILQKCFPLDVYFGENNCFLMVYKKFVELYKPHHLEENSADYVFSAMLAAYQLGISMFKGI